MPILFSSIKINNFIPLILETVEYDLNGLLKIYNKEDTQYYTRSYILYYILDQYNNEQNGGNLYKINKYLYKIKQNSDIKYKKKYDYYKNIQYGGTTDTTIIENIIIDNIKFSLNQDACSEDNDNDNDIDIDNDQNITKCINTLLPLPDQRSEYERNILKYMDSRNYKSISTDSFMNLLSSKYKLLYNKIFNYTLIQLYLCFTKCIYLFNKKMSLTLTDKHIYLIYKGGNSIRLLLQLYTWTSTLNDNDSKDIEKNMNIGDWDFTIKTNFIEILNVISHANLNILLDYLKKSCAVALTNIKKLLETELLQNNEFNTDYISKCTSQIPPFFAKDVCVINNNKSKQPIVENITVPIPIVDKICSMGDDKKSFTIYNDNLTKNIKKITVLDNFFENQTDNMINNKIFIVYIDKISSYGYKTYTNFSLFRLKINNIIKNEYDNNNSINAPIELIDISISNYTDTDIELNKEILFDNIYSLIGNDKSKYLANKYILNNIIIPFPILSANYMFIDIYVMLFVDNYFPWIDKKFKKRLSRLFKIYLLCDKCKSESDITEKKNNLLMFNRVIEDLLSNFTNNFLNLDSQLILIKIYEFYNSQKQYFKIKNKNNYYYIINDNNNNITDLYLTFLYNNIFEIIISIIYIYDDSILTQEHSVFCYEHFRRLKDCDGNRCDELNMTVYSFIKLKDEPNIDCFISYLQTMKSLSNYIRRYVAIQIGPDDTQEQLY
jgi:hypothetical protein